MKMASETQISLTGDFLMPLLACFMPIVHWGSRCDGPGIFYHPPRTLVEAAGPGWSSLWAAVRAGGRAAAAGPPRAWGRSRRGT